MQGKWIALLIYLLFINLLGVGLVVSDKARARRRWRIPERALFAAALLGGCPGVYLSMRAVRHKTLHRRFMIGLPVLFALQLLAGCALWRFRPV